MTIKDYVRTEQLGKSLLPVNWRNIAVTLIDQRSKRVMAWFRKLNRSSPRRCQRWWAALQGTRKPISSHLSAYGDVFREVDRLRDEVGWLQEEQVSREQAVWPPPRTAFMAGRAAFLALNRLGGRVLAGKERPLAVANGLILFQLRRTSSYRM